MLKYVLLFSVLVSGCSSIAFDASPVAFDTATLCRGGEDATQLNVDRNGSCQ